MTKGALEFQFERRRYGKGSFFCWAWVKHGDKWLSLGDPWPGVHWRRAELEEEALRAIERHTEQPNPA